MFGNKYYRILKIRTAVKTVANYFRSNVM